LYEKQTDVVYPFNGHLYDVPRHLHENINIDELSINDCGLMSNICVGGAIFFRKDVFIAGGCANENFYGLGYEDNEIFERYKKLGYEISRINAHMFHLTHQRKETSYDYNPYVEHNKQEFIRIYKISKEKLLNEIKKWNYAS